MSSIKRKCLHSALSAVKRQDTLGEAVRRALVPRRSAVHLSAGLLSLGLVAHGATALAAPFPAEFDLSDLLPSNGGNGSAGFILNGIDIGDESGHAVSAAGDINGDGIDDLIIGAIRADPGDVSRNSAGASYVVFGREMTAEFPAELELSSLSAANGGDGSAGFILNGINGGDVSGWSVSAAGDVNGDGVDDLIIGATGAEPGGRVLAGQSFVVFGRDQTAFPAELELSSLLPSNGGDGRTGFVLHGIARGDYAGFSVSAGGDINGDGIDDLVIGAGFAQFDNDGETYVVFGRDQAMGGFPAEFELSNLPNGNGSTGFILPGISLYDYSGWSVSAAGDVNGDGIDDLLIGAVGADPFANGYARYSAGQTYVVFGQLHTEATFPARFELHSLEAGNGGDGSAGFILHGSDRSDYSGWSVSAAGDVNGDGVDDLLIGAYRADPGGRMSAGESYVVFGRQMNEPFPAEFELASLRPAKGGDGRTGFILNGIDSGDGSGRSVSAAGDVSGDGIDDLIIGASGAEPAGESYVVFGRDQTQAGFPAIFNLRSLRSANGGDGRTGFMLNGIDSGDGSGRSVSDAGDVNGDGIDDLLIGAPYADPGGRNNAGESYVLFGRITQTMCDGLIATIVGTEGPDVITGTAARDVIHTLGGNDTIRGLGGHDVICAGDGNDTVYGGAGNDTMFGGAGTDKMLGGGGRDVIRGSDGDDELRGGGGNDQLFGLAGADKLFGDNGNDFLDGGAAIDRCDGGGGSGDTAANCETKLRIP